MFNAREMKRAKEIKRLNQTVLLNGENQNNIRITIVAFEYAKFRKRSRFENRQCFESV